MVRETSLIVFNKYCNYLFIKYELGELELNKMNVYGWYDVISMFVNDLESDKDIIFSGEKIPCWDC